MLGKLVSLISRKKKYIIITFVVIGLGFLFSGIR